MGYPLEPTALDAWNAAFAELCAGFDRPLLEARVAAYRKAFGKLNTPAWEAAVEFCLSESGPEKFPTIHVLWGIIRKLQRQRRHTQKQAEDDAGHDFSRYASAANLVLLALAYQDTRRGLVPIGQYPAMPTVSADSYFHVVAKGGYGIPPRRPQPIDDSLLVAALATKAEIVTAAEEAKRAGDPWDDSDFNDTIQSALEKALGTLTSFGATPP